MGDETTSRPWRWPAEWAVDEKFWREVATRTIAGILTLVFLGVPGLIYAVSVGALTPDQAAPIWIGIGLFLGVILLYVAAIATIGAVSRSRERAALRAEAPPAELTRRLLRIRRDASFARFVVLATGIGILVTALLQELPPAH